MGVMDQQERMEDSFLFFLCNYCLGEPFFSVPKAYHSIEKNAIEKVQIIKKEKRNKFLQ